MLMCCLFLFLCVGKCFHYESSYIMNSEAQRMGRDEFWHISGNVHPGLVVHRQICLKHNVGVYSLCP